MGCIAVHGPFYGTYLAAKRILRCNPFFKGGFENVPKKNGQEASEILATSHPFVAKQLAQEPGPHFLGQG
jgi:putative component of membrane protein insertase Oxa1/YidC/SpoIIIJ protein YidD